MGLFGHRKAGEAAGTPSGRVNLYCIWDRVAEDSSPPFAARNDGVATRELRALLERVAPYDRDAYLLMRIGSWESTTMTGDIYTTPELVDVPECPVLSDGAGDETRE